MNPARRNTGAKWILMRACTSMQVPRNEIHFAPGLRLPRSIIFPPLYLVCRECSSMLLLGMNCSGVECVDRHRSEQTEQRRITPLMDFTHFSPLTSRGRHPNSRLEGLEAAAAAAATFSCRYPDARYSFDCRTRKARRIFSLHYNE